jgi:hypothetical protein
MRWRKKRRRWSGEIVERFWHSSWGDKFGNMTRLHIR